MPSCTHRPSKNGKIETPRFCHLKAPTAPKRSIKPEAINRAEVIDSKSAHRPPLLEELETCMPAPILSARAATKRMIQQNAPPHCTGSEVLTNESLRPSSPQPGDTLDASPCNNCQQHASPLQCDRWRGPSGDMLSCPRVQMVFDHPDFYLQMCLIPQRNPRGRVPRQWPKPRAGPLDVDEPKVNTQPQLALPTSTRKKLWQEKGRKLIVADALLASLH